MVRVPRTVALALAAMPFLGACSAAEEPQVPASPSSEQASPPVGAVGSMECGDSALLEAPGEAATAFPDNPGVEWTARPTDVVIGELVIVGLTPDRDEVGYPELRFVYRCDTHGPARIATYALDEGRFVLLATTDVLGDEELPAELAGPVEEPGAP